MKYLLTFLLLPVWAWAQSVPAQEALAQMYPEGTTLTAENIVFNESWVTPTSEGNRYEAIVVVQTSTDDCHACGAHLDGGYFTKDRYTDNEWQMSKFRKTFAITGEWGTPGELSLMKAGEYSHLLQVDFSGGGQGYMVSVMELYNPQMGFDRMIALRMSEDNSGTCGPGLQKCWGYTSKLRINKQYEDEVDGFYELVITTTGTKDDHRPINVTKRYRSNGLMYDAVSIQNLPK